jgi:hypothetical protein
VPQKTVVRKKCLISSQRAGLSLVHHKHVVEAKHIHQTNQYAIQLHLGCMSFTWGIAGEPLARRSDENEERSLGRKDVRCDTCLRRLS